MTGEQAARIILKAALIAASAPKRQGSYTYRAGVAWPLVHELRAELEAAGVDWKKYAS